MMPDLDILRELIRDDTLVIAANDLHGRDVLVLEETRAKPAYAVTIRGLPGAVLAIKADEFPVPRFRGDRGERKRADFIIFAWTATRNWIIYVEMKGGKTHSEKDIEHQLMGAQCLVAYCRAAGQVFWERAEDFLEEANYQQRFVSVKEIGVNKQPTRRRNRPGLHDTPRNMLKIVAPGNSEVRFRRLIGGEAV